jgi:hypothetical protein
VCETGLLCGRCRAQQSSGRNILVVKQHVKRKLLVHVVNQFDRLDVSAGFNFDIVVEHRSESHGVSYITSMYTTSCLFGAVVRFTNVVTLLYSPRFKSPASPLLVSYLIYWQRVNHNAYGALGIRSMAAGEQRREAKNSQRSKLQINGRDVRIVSSPDFERGIFNDYIRCRSRRNTCGYMWQSTRVISATTSQTWMSLSFENRPKASRTRSLVRAAKSACSCSLSSSWRRKP